MSDYSIGYWANTKRWTQTHVRNNRTGKPVCGSGISWELGFQWCAHIGQFSSYYYFHNPDDYIECGHCKKWADKTLTR